MTQQVVVARDIEVTFGGQAIWSSVDFEIGAGTFTVILGPNGAGKSTLLKAILGLQPTSRGTLEVLDARRRGSTGADRLRPPAPELRRPASDPWRRVVPPGDRRRPVGVPFRKSEPRRSQRASTADRARRGRRLRAGRSGSCREASSSASSSRRPSLAVPQLLLLDEPLDSLDSEPGRGRRAHQRICREQGVTVVMVAHDVNPILPYLDESSTRGRHRRERISGGRSSRARRSERSTDTDVEVLRAADGRLVVVGQPEAPATLQYTTGHAGGDTGAHRLALDVRHLYDTRSWSTRWRRGPSSPSMVGRSRLVHGPA